MSRKDDADSKLNNFTRLLSEKIKQSQPVYDPLRESVIENKAEIQQIDEELQARGSIFDLIATKINKESKPKVEHKKSPNNPSIIDLIVKDNENPAKQETSALENESDKLFISSKENEEEQAEEEQAEEVVDTSTNVETYMSDMPVEAPSEELEGLSTTAQEHALSKRVDQFTAQMKDLEQRSKVHAESFGGGGGTNAVQFRDGGTMYGDLTIKGVLSAATYLGISGTSLWSRSNTTLTTLNANDSVRIDGTLSISTLSAQSNNTISPATTGIRLGSHNAAFSAIHSNEHHFEPLDEAPVHEEGLLYYAAADKTLTLYSDIADVSLNIGQEQWIRVSNKTGSTITNGQVVYINGAQGNRPTIGLADANTETTANLIGIATHDIVDNAQGYVTTQGLVRDVNTTDFTEGDIIYTSLTAGAFTNVQLDAPFHAVEVGHIIRAHPTQGIILASIGIDVELSDAHDVSYTQPSSAFTNGALLTWVSSASAWRDDITSSNKWNNTYNIVNSNSANWNSVYTIVNKAVDYTVTTSDYTINATASGIIITLPTSIGIQGQIYVIKNSSNSTITLSANGAETIDTHNIIQTEPPTSITVQSTNTNWIII
tara:strand:- start:7703 stop:9505 length:1803 start_codon:yes stop_codon:yes gene_type:complete